MRKGRFTEEQMGKILREADKTPVADVAKLHGVTERAMMGGQAHQCKVRDLPVEL